MIGETSLLANRGGRSLFVEGRNTVRLPLRIFGVLILALTLYLNVGTVKIAYGAPPPLPFVYSGTTIAANGQIPDSIHDINGISIGSVGNWTDDPLLRCTEFCIVARIGTSYESFPTFVDQGRYTALNLGPPDKTYSKKLVTFHLVHGKWEFKLDPGMGLKRWHFESVDLGIAAQETDTYTASDLPTVKFGFTLTFSDLPQATATPTATITPTPVMTNPAVYSGVVAVLDGQVPAKGILVARIGDYESVPAILDGDEFRNLVVLPTDLKLVGKAIEFFLNGVKSNNTDIYESGSFNPNFMLLFQGLPTPTPIPPSATPIPTSTHIPTPTAHIPPSPTLTAVPPSATPIPTSTHIPTPTVIPSATPTPEVAVVSPTAIPPTATPITGAVSGGCFAVKNESNIMTGAGNLLMFVGPLGLIAVLKRRKTK